MSGTREGGRKAAETNLKRHGKNFYAEIGRRGGSKGAADGAIKGFAAMTQEKRRAAGAKGGKISRRGPAEAKPVAKPVVKAMKKTVKNVEDDFVAPKPTAKEAEQIRENFFRRMFRRNK